MTLPSGGGESPASGTAALDYPTAGAPAFDLGPMSFPLPPIVRPTTDWRCGTRHRGVWYIPHTPDEELEALQPAAAMLGSIQFLAYLDPASGSLLLQLILGGVAGLALVLKLFWHRILGLFGIKKSKDEKPAA